jgi:predicted nucleic acid-binding protein
VYEVFKVVHRQRGEGDAIMAVALMQQGSVVDLSMHLALEASRAGIALGLSMADSMILATARAQNATLWTQDADFATVDGVKYVARREAE